MKILSSLAVALCLAIGTAASAAPVVSQVACSSSDVQDAFACSGAFAGNELGTASVLANTGAQFGNLYAANGGFDNSPFTLIDTSDNTAGSQISFIYETGGALGKVVINDPTSILNSTIFGVALKASDSYSLYIFDGALLSAPFGTTMENLAPFWTMLDYTTAGTSVNKRGTPQNLSHASLWQGPTSGNFGGCFGDPQFCDPVAQVPEPGSLALMGAGLGAMVFTRRRKTQVGV